MEAFLPPEAHDPLELNQLYWANVGGAQRWILRRFGNWYFGPYLGIAFSEIIGPVTPVETFDWTI